MSLYEIQSDCCLGLFTVLVGVVVWATSIAGEGFRTASRMHEPILNQFAFVYVVIAFLALTLAIMVFVWAFNKK